MGGPGPPLPLYTTFNQEGSLVLAVCARKAEAALLSKGNKKEACE